MAWIEQTKKGSRKSGGPQYYLQGLSDTVTTVLEAKRRRPLVLWTPYGLVETQLAAVSKRVGAVGHDRIQTTRRGVPQIAEQVAYWYALKSRELETIEFADVASANVLLMVPSRITFFGRKQPRKLQKDSHPLTVTAHHRSPFLLAGIRDALGACAHCRKWVVDQIGELVEQHERATLNVDEKDLLRASGALHRLGVNLGMYRTHGLDCPEATFCMGGLPGYPCPVEIEERSRGFLAAHHDADRGRRVVVLCMEHDASEVLSESTDVIELRGVFSALKDIA
jgi:hypothetical protein